MHAIGPISKPSTKAATAWQTLSQILPPRDEDKDYWWQLTGFHMAHILHEAGYSLAKQYETLLFHYHWAVPYLGPRPGPKGPAVWESKMAHDASPIEYSWKWNAADGVDHPCVRYSIEPISRASGTTADPLNQLAGRDLYQKLAAQVPSMDIEWTEHFMATLFDENKYKYAQEAKAGTQFTTSFMFSIEVHEEAFTFKTYFIPRKLGGEMGIPLSAWKNSLAQLQAHNPSRDMVYDFLETSLEGQKMFPITLAVDAVEPVESRLKLYFQGSQKTLRSVYEIMTMDGRIPHSASQLEDLRSLICAVTGVADDFPDDQAPPQTQDSRSTISETYATETPDYIYYFDMAPTRACPDVKLYVPARFIGPSDLGIAQNLVAWMRKRGRGAFGDNYLRMLSTVASHRKLEDGKGIHAYIGIKFNKNGELDVTSYIGAEVFSPHRMQGVQGAVTA